MNAPQSITCPKCGFTSYHPKDIEQGYCGKCHDWTSPSVAVEPTGYILAGIPADRAEQERVGIRHYIPSPGSGKFPCSRCQIEVWLGPKQQTKKTELPETPILCPLCMKHMLVAGDMVKNLGGAGGHYQLSDGSTIAPDGTKN